MADEGKEGGPEDAEGGGKFSRNESLPDEGRPDAGGIERFATDDEPELDSGDELSNVGDDKSVGTCSTAPHVGHFTRMPTDSSRTRKGLRHFGQFRVIGMESVPKRKRASSAAKGETRESFWRLSPIAIALTMNDLAISKRMSVGQTA